MATSAEIQAETDTANTMFIWRIQSMIPNTDTDTDSHYVVGITPPYMGKAGWINTDNTGNAAAQAAEIDAALPLL